MWKFDRCASQDIWGFKELKQGGAVREAIPWWVDKNIDTARVWSSIAVFIAACKKHVHGRDIKLSQNQTSVSEQYTPLRPGIIRSGKGWTLLTETLRNIAYAYLTVWRLEDGISSIEILHTDLSKANSEALVYTLKQKINLKPLRRNPSANLCLILVRLKTCKETEPL